MIVGNSLVAFGIRRSKSQQFGILGLVDVLSPAFWIGLAVIVTGLVIACYRGSRWAWLNVVALMTALHGLPGLLEPNPRFSVAWIHTGFVEHIATDGTLLKSLDARFSWAGFFSARRLVATVDRHRLVAVARSIRPPVLQRRRSRTDRTAGQAPPGNRDAVRCRRRAVLLPQLDRAGLLRSAGDRVRAVSSYRHRRALRISR